ncbi:unnamed protein product [Phytophthora fragariaefolia]|uniref:RNA-directed DNA polymerase n=1 Tax=Phytophthora fragariaefolia TaxID=1490495 RepID=A0A9W6YDZ0_9STRA|nr:unnamed protein product [Phytophthora fragariaefolia]
MWRLLECTRVEQREIAGGSSDDEYLFVGLRAPPASSSPPMRIMIKLENGKERYRALLDSGCSHNIISTTVMQALQTQGPQLETSAVAFELAKGSTQSKGAMEVRFRIPQLKRNSFIIHTFEVLPTLRDDMTIGRDLMTPLGLVIDFKNGRVQWDGSELVLQTTAEKNDQPSVSDSELTQDEDEEYFAGDMVAVTPMDLLPKHLEEALQHCYLKLLEEYADLYNERLGRIRLPNYILPLRADFVPTQSRPYSVPRSQEEAARREIQRLVELDVLEQIYGLEPSAPAFFLVKQDGSLRLLVDFRQLNKYLHRSPYYVPKIRETLLRLDKAKCMSTLDANMGHFARYLAQESRPATAFCSPFGKYQFKRLPMGISTAPDRLRQFDVTCHILREQVDYLGFTLTADGIQPQTKKIEAIQQIADPRNKRELRPFLGMIAYYREMAPNKSAMAARLNRLTSKNIPFTWTPEDAAAFQEIKAALARNVWLAFPDFNFHVFADASGQQIGGAIMQGKRIIACFSRSMTDAQRKYSTMEWELLSVVEILKEYRTMLLGFPVVVHTDPKNLLFPRANSLRVKRWKILLEEYRLQVAYVPGRQNVGADAFSRLRYNFVQQVAEDELFAVDEEEVAIDGVIMKKHQLQDET